MSGTDEGTHKAFRAKENAPGPGPGREDSPEERDGVPDTDATARTPLGVGESINERAEDVARGTEELDGRKGASDRPHARDTTRDSGSDPATGGRD